MCKRTLIRKKLIQRSLVQVNIQFLKSHSKVAGAASHRHKKPQWPRQPLSTSPSNIVFSSFSFLGNPNSCGLFREGEKRRRTLLHYDKERKSVGDWLEGNGRGGGGGGGHFPTPFPPFHLFKSADTGIRGGRIEYSE